MKNTKYFLLPVFICFFFLSFHLIVNAQSTTQYYEEVINSYDSAIQIQKDRSLIVKETIDVNALNININHGIYRDFPTQYTDSNGKAFRVGFEVLDVTKDGLPEPYTLENQSNGVRVKIGNSSKYVSIGEHTYTITFKTTKQLGLFDDHDELYFNAIGTGWQFPITKSSVEVTLPDKFNDNQIQIASYTGEEGSKTTTATSSIDQSNSKYTIVNFKNITSLPENNGFTIVVGWPKGHITYPTKEELAMEAFLSNLYLYIIVVSLFLIFIYYLFVWIRYGKDPKAGIVIPEYTMDENISPSLVSYVDKMGYDNNALTSNFVDLARKKLVNIKDENNIYSIQLIGKDPGNLPEEEEYIFKELDKESDKTLSFTGTYSSKIEDFVDGFKSLLDIIGRSYFHTNNGRKTLGIFLTIFLISISTLTFFILDSTNDAIIFLIMGMVFTFVGIFVTASIILRVLKPESTSSTIKTLFSCCFTLLFGLPFLGLGIGMLYMSSYGIIGILIVIIINIINVVGSNTLSARTVKGSQLQDKIDGLKMYIKTAETERLKLLYKTFDEAVQNYEKILPYAIALGLELEWTNKFSKVFDMFKEQTGNVYVHPIWYLGATNSFNARSFSNSLSTNIASSVVAPGSSSGFSSGGGGGFSGGGGGGGGGGGW